MSREERHIRMRSLSPAPNHLLMRSRSRSRCGPGYSSGKSKYANFLTWSNNSILNFIQIQFEHCRWKVLFRLHSVKFLTDALRVALDISEPHISFLP